MSEEWRPMVDHPKFRVSSEGRVANIDGKIYSQFVTKKGYAQINVCEFGKTFTFKVHREVAKAFLPMKDERDQVNHKDGNKLNNRVENLEWCSAKENMQHAAHVLGFKGKPHDEIRVLCVETGKEYASIHEAARQTGFPRQSITKCCKKPHYTCHGFHWRFKKGGGKENAKGKVADAEGTDESGFQGKGRWANESGAYVQCSLIKESWDS